MQNDRPAPNGKPKKKGKKGKVISRQISATHLLSLPAVHRPCGVVEWGCIPSPHPLPGHVRFKRETRRCGSDFVAFHFCSLLGRVGPAFSPLMPRLFAVHAESRLLGCMHPGFRERSIPATSTAGSRAVRSRSSDSAQQTGCRMSFRAFSLWLLSLQFS